MPHRSYLTNIRMLIRSSTFEKSKIRDLIVYPLCKKEDLPARRFISISVN